VGWGDEIMVTGIAKRLNADAAKPVVVIGRDGNQRWHEIWTDNPRIMRHSWDRKSLAHVVHNGPSVRPYIAAKTDERWVWKDFDCTPGEIYFSPAEKTFAKDLARGSIIIEPNCKAKASPNKDWGRARWQALADLMRKAGLNPLQMGNPGDHVLHNVPMMVTPSFRMACAVLATCRAAVLPEGGLHHAAAALGVRAVVVYGGYISPRQTGYNLHRNLFTGGEPCGMRRECSHCKKAMSEISPEFVLSQLLEVING
jgi:ADP-heptose:LPS heptosyltransferase